VLLIENNVYQVIEAIPAYQQKVTLIFHTIFANLQIPEPTSLEQTLSKVDVASLISTSATTLLSLVNNAGLIIFYLLLLLFEYGTFKGKINIAILDPNRRQSFINTMQQIDKDIRSYLVLKSILGIITGIIGYIILKIFGVDFALFWGLLLFLLYYIPTIGPLIAMAFPICLSLVQFDTIYPFLGVTIGLISLQILVGNIIEIKLMGRSINLSSLVIMISLVLWGSIWGIIGMFLSVPIMVTINVILSKFEETRWISVMLSEKGELK
jgi:predicted PurR-regulated permease PerM